ncbi:hypothetical protein HK100_011435 [Physocladia obscura]|uniref:Uncharacterized protein n=1 Tax=Physocladia obscura TaxID=109957 RepID=A0AAD5XIB1_9FUNG|nr:hypothetical protein HK100_011435 [Physocladia obscura]
MPNIKFNTRAQVLAITPHTTEKLVALSGNSRVRIQYGQIAGIRVQPAEAFKFAAAVKARQQRVISRADVRIPGNAKPDLFLFATAANAIGLELHGHPKYAAVYFDVANHPPASIAARIQAELRLAAAVSEISQNR